MPLAVDTDGAAAREEVKGFAAAIARAAVLAIPQEDVPEQLWSEIEELIVSSYCLIAPKRLAAQVRPPN